MQGYDARNASLTLGMEIIETNRNIRFLLRETLDIMNIKSVEATLDWMDGYLQHYRDDMKLSYWDPTTKKMITSKKYEEAMELIQGGLEEAEHYLEEDRMQRIKYVFWLNRRSELLASCFPKLGLLPPSRADGPQRKFMDEQGDEESEEPEIVLTDMGEEDTEEEEPYNG